MSAPTIASDVRSAASSTAPFKRRSALFMVARRRPLAVVGLLVLITVGVAAVFADVVAPRDPVATSTAIYEPPSRQWLLGTDEIGRDVFSRVLYGARVSFVVGFSVVAVSSVVGSAIGIGSAYAGGWIDLLAQRVIDAIMSMPGLILALLVVVALGESLTNVIIALSISRIANFSRTIRSVALSVNQRDFIEAARATGAGHIRIMVLHVFPGCLAPLIVIASVSLGTTIVAEASLSFLGVGVPPPTPSWGGMLSRASQAYVGVAPWLIFAPGIALSLVVFSFNFLGDGIRDQFDPRMRGT